jgi:hypothetical protein
MAWDYIEWPVIIELKEGTEYKDIADKLTDLNIKEAKYLSELHCVTGLVRNKAIEELRKLVNKGEIKRVSNLAGHIYELQKT